MGLEEPAPQNGTATPTENGAPEGAAPPPEEPPKIEDIVTPEVLQKIINGYNPDLSLVSWEAELGTNAGDNYMSIMYSVDINLENKKGGGKEKLHVMLKTLPTNIFRAEMINEMKAFTKESSVYADVLSSFIEVQEERGIQPENVFRAWPKCYASHIDGKGDFLAMENLKVQGFKMGSRKIGLDFNHASIVLRALAKYHAISYVKYGGSREKIMERFPMIGHGMFVRDNKTAEMQGQFFTTSFKQMADSLREAGEDLAAARVDKMGDADHITVLGDLTEKVENAVITHGDFWVNNMLFKYDEKDTKSSFPVDAMMIDFQLCQASSRLVDFYYFLLTSCNVQVLNEREQDLLMIYYSEFTSYAERLGMNTREKGLTWENLVKEADNFRLYGVFLGVLLAPMFAAEASDIPDMESFTQEDMENTDETVKKFFKDLTNDMARQKVKTIVLKHLPKCPNGVQFL